MIQKKKPSQPANRRSVRRCPLVASAEVTDLHSGTRLLVRISELGVGGCYIDALTPFPEGTLVKLRILRDQGGAQHRYRALRVENALTDEHGDDARLTKGADVDVTITAKRVDRN
jgi:hypothetical protein